MKSHILLLVIVGACVCIPARAGVGLMTGESEDEWAGDRCSVIVAKVDSINPADPDAVGELKLTLLPQATIGGSFDCRAEPKVVAAAWYGVGGNSAIEDRPRKGTLVLALVCMYESEDFYRVPNVGCPLLPNKQPLCVINSLDDPAVAQTLARIQAARAVAKRKAAEAAKKR